ncbi:Candidapepsin-9 [Candida viswanathii]|uniref:Candidapepsin-9 n=1 Tax=Candida viswanathii TaxID=5486 RepID=A0A367Y0J7_9ASCO|nr:Candidapepsin-9 [Candida viswanathii]
MNLLLLIYITIVYAGSLQLNLKPRPKTVSRIKIHDISLPAKQREGYYGIELGFGSENETVEVLLDTGSSDLWVPDASFVCDLSAYAAEHDVNVSEVRLTCPTSSFDWQQSTSFHNSQAEFRIVYGDGSAAVGFYGRDSVTMGDVVLNDTVFAVANSTDGQGIMGIGFPELEVSNLDPANASMYENFPHRLKSAGVTDRAIYSIQLTDDAPGGTILFGAVDRQKFVGDLVTLPVLTPIGVRQRLIVQLDSVLLGEDGKIPTLIALTSNALIDTGSTESWFPQKTLQKMAELLDGEEKDDDYLVNSTVAENKKLYVTFLGLTIGVPVNVEPIDSERSELHYGLQEKFQGIDIIIGQDILSKLYVVFDLESLEISMAQQSDSKESDIELVGADGHFNKLSTYKNYESSASSQAGVSVLLLLFSLLVTSIGC